MKVFMKLRRARGARPTGVPFTIAKCEVFDWFDVAPAQGDGLVLTDNPGSFEPR